MHAPHSNHRTYYGIQALRFVAAMLVVLAHSTAMVSERMHLDMFKWRAGWSGVDIFFVISGFVMAISSNTLMKRPDGWRIFLARRIIRIVPLYWTATTLKLAILLALPAFALDSRFEWWSTISSYLFIPTFDENSLLAAPLLKVGWTLNYEMFFYAIFTLALFLGKSPLLFTSTIFALAVGANLISTPNAPFFHGFLEPILLEFVMGMLLSKLCAGVNFQGAELPSRPRRGAQDAFHSILHRLSNSKAGAALGVGAIVVCFAIMFHCADLPMWWRWAYWGLPSMVIVFVVALGEPAIRRYMPRIFAALGDSSYSLYLFHTFTVPILGTIMMKMNVTSPSLALAVCVVVSPIVCHAIYAWFEHPVTNMLKQGSRVGA